MKYRYRLAVILAGIALPLGMITAASPAHSASRTCSRSISVTHGSDYVQAHMIRTCGHTFRAYADFGGETDYGTWRTAAGTYSVACDVSSCQGHPDGTLFHGGYERSDGTYFQTF